MNDLPHYERLGLLPRFIYRYTGKCHHEPLSVNSRTLLHPCASRVTLPQVYNRRLSRNRFDYKRNFQADTTTREQNRIRSIVHQTLFIRK